LKTEFRKAELPREVRSLQAFDRKAFREADRFPAAYWKVCESWWMVAGGVKIGCCAFERDSPRKGSLYIATTGILPDYRHRGFGTLLKAWEIGYARFHGFRRIVANSRKSNAAMIALNRKFGFRVIRTVARYYAEPVEAAVVMELKF
jgi:ribosomal protein S18 acetylase RimI-like enzyme